MFFFLFLFFFFFLNLGAGEEQAGRGGRSFKVKPNLLPGKSGHLPGKLDCLQGRSGRLSPG
jgi:hypothetical protein